MSGQSAHLSIKEAKAMQEAVQHSCSQAKCGGSHSHGTSSGGAMDHNTKKPNHQGK
jgi:hypothetical protein